MKQESEIAVDALIGKYLSGEATPEEAILLDSWIIRSPENKRRFDEACRIWENAGPAVPYNPSGPEKEWHSMNAALKRSKSVHRFWKIAAAVAVIITTAAVFGYFYRVKQAEPAFVSFITAKEGTVKDTLPDRSVATLVRGTELKVGKEFGKEIRAVRLSEGEGFFVVNKNAGGPFVIHVGDVTLTVLGTAFDVNNAPAMVTVAVASGKVKMKANDQTILVTGGSTAAYFKKTRELRLYRDSLDENTYSYFTGALKFDNMNLAEVKQILEKTYGVRVRFGDPSLADLKINTRFYHEPLEYVLKVISASLNIQYRIEGKNVYFFDENMP